MVCISLVVKWGKNKNVLFFFCTPPKGRVLSGAAGGRGAKGAPVPSPASARQVGVGGQQWDLTHFTETAVPKQGALRAPRSVCPWAAPLGHPKQPGARP